MALRVNAIFCNGFRVICPVQSHARKYFRLRLTQITGLSVWSRSGRGASAIVTNVGTGCGGRSGVARAFCAGRTTLTRTAKSCGPDAPMLAFKSRGVFCATTVTTKPGHRGEHEVSRKTIAQGMPVETGEPVEDYRILCGHGCIGHPAFPAPSLEGRAAPSCF